MIDIIGILMVAASILLIVIIIFAFVLFWPMPTSSAADEESYDHLPDNDNSTPDTSNTNAAGKEHKTTLR